ncbi:MAG: CorA family divalent cation transporter [Synechococcaceae cyanobacterium]|nr:CorA family divalent cation transporter [Synechococcaceae cyanobacterium]
MDAMVFHAEAPELRPLAGLEDLEALLALQRPLWLRMRGLADGEGIRTLLARCGVPASLADPLVEAPQRPQVDYIDEAVLVVLQRLALPLDQGQLVSDQVGALLLPGLLITIEEAGDASFPELTHWLMARSTAVELRDLDDILHFVVDDLLDDLFPIQERIANRLDELEEEVLRRPNPRLLTLTFRYRSKIRTIRRQIWPLRHQIRVLLRERQPLLGPEATSGFEEMEEIVDLLFESCGMLRMQCDAITQAYTAGVGNRMNQVMKTLTILTSIFAPLTFIAGIYGMNFDGIPELHWRFGYAYALLLMAVVGAIQAWWLWRRGWFEDWTGHGPR